MQSSPGLEILGDTAWGALLAWAAAAGITALARLSRARGHRSQRKLQTGIAPTRFTLRKGMAAAGVVGVALGALTASGALDGAERPFREQLWRLKRPIAPRLIPDAAIIDFRCREVPLELGLWFALMVHRAGARAALLVPPSSDLEGLTQLPKCKVPPGASQRGLARDVAAGHSLLPADFPTVLALGDSDPPAVRLSSPDEGVRVGHLRQPLRSGRYQILQIVTRRDGGFELSAAALLAGELAGLSAGEIEATGPDRVRFGDQTLALEPDGTMILGVTPSPMASAELKVHDAYSFQQNALNSGRIANDLTWEEFCRDRLVLVGVYAREDGVLSRLAVAYWGANTILARLRMEQGDRLPAAYLPRPVGRALGGFLVLMAALLAGAVGLGHRPLSAALVLAATAACLALTGAAICLKWQIVLPIGGMVLALSASGVIAIQLSWMFVEARRSQVEANLGRYVSPQVADEVLKEGTPSLGGQRQKVTVLFADVRGFGLIAENAEPEALVELVNAYFRVVVDVVFEYGGTLDKFIGDSVMAVWGAPMQHADDARKAVRAAVAICERAKELSNQRAAQGLDVAELAIGLSTGDAVAGNIGDERRMEYTVIGDTVNVASRLQGLASGGNADIAVGEATYRETQGMVVTEPLGQVRVKHRAEPVTAYSVTGLMPRSQEAHGDGIG